MYNVSCVKTTPLPTTIYVKHLNQPALFYFLGDMDITLTASRVISISSLAVVDCMWLTIWELLLYGAMVALWSTHAVGCKGRHSCKVSPTCQWLRHSSNLSIKGERLPILSVGAWQKSSTTSTGITTAMTARLLAILSLLLVARQLTGESKKPHVFKTSTYNVCCLNYMQWYTT